MTRALACLLAAALLVATALGQPAPSLRIVTDGGPVEEPFKVFFGGSAFFYAVPAELDLTATRFRPQMALPGVEWWAFRTHDLRGDARPSTEGHPGFEEGHRLPPRRTWDQLPIPHVWPDEMRKCWSSGRYVVMAESRGRRRATLRVTVAAFLLHEFESDHTADHFEATFHIGLADPDLSSQEVPIQVETLDENGRRVSRLGGGKLVRFDGAYRTPRRVRLSSRVTAEQVAARPPDATWSSLRAVPDGMLRVTIGDRIFEFPLPIEEGLLVQRMRSPPWGHEGPVLSASSRSIGNPAKAQATSSARSRSGGSRGSTGRNPKPERPGNRKDPKAAGDGSRWTSHDPASHRDAELEIVSSAGRGKRLKLWLGEPVSFAARKRPDGLDDVFRPTRWLRDVYWTLVRTSVPPAVAPIAITPGVKRVEVGRAGPPGRWGDPPSIFECPDDVLARWKPGRYVLTATRPGGASAAVRIDLASFEIIDVIARLESGKYAASMRFQLTDPAEIRNRIPIAVRIVSSRGEVRDYLGGASLSRDLSRPHVFRSGRVYVSTSVKTPCMARYGDDSAAAKAAGQPPILRIPSNSLLRVRLDQAAFSYPLPLSVDQIWTGRSGATDQPTGR